MSDEITIEKTAKADTPAPDQKSPAKPAKGDAPVPQKGARQGGRQGNAPRSSRGNGKKPGPKRPPANHVKPEGAASTPRQKPYYINPNQSDSESASTGAKPGVDNQKPVSSDQTKRKNGKSNSRNPGSREKKPANQTPAPKKGNPGRQNTPKGPKQPKEAEVKKESENAPGQKSSEQVTAPKSTGRPYRIPPWVLKKQEKEKKKQEAAAAAQKESEQKPAKSKQQNKPKNDKQQKKSAGNAPQKPVKAAGKKGMTQPSPTAKKGAEAARRPNKEAPKQVPKEKKHPIATERSESIFEDKRTPKRSYWSAEEEKERQKAKAMMALENDISKKVIKSGIISGVAPIGVFKDICAVVATPDYQVFIPFSDMFCVNPIEDSSRMDNDALRRRQESILINSVGAPIHYVILRSFVTGKNGDQVCGIGNRREAMMRDQARFYFKDEEHDHPFIVEGGIYEADIIAVGVHGIRVNLFGVDTQMWLSSITYKWVENARHCYKNGDKIRVAVRSIKKREDGNGLELELSGKDVENREKRMKSSRLTVGGVYTAHITRLKAGQTGRSSTAFLYIDNYDVPAVSSMISASGGFRTVRPGSQVALRINKIDPENGNVAGTITQVINRNAIADNPYYSD